MIDLKQLMVAAVMMFLGATVLSAVGFGIGMVSMPGLVLALEPQSAVVMMNTVAVGLEAWIVFQARKDLPLKEILPIAITGVLGVPIAIFILSSADSATLRVGISVLILALAALSLVNFRREIPYGVVVGPVAGFVVGIVLPSMGVGGPLVTIFLLTKNWSRQAIRAAMAFYLLSLDVFSVGGYAIAGLYTKERLLLIVAVIIPVLLGLWLGSLLLRRMNERIFRYASIAIIVVSSLAVLGREISNI